MPIERFGTYLMFIRLKDQLMKSNRHSVMERVMLAAALAVGIPGAACAEDSSMGRLGGDSHAFFNSQPIAKSLWAWRQANPMGLPERALQAESATSASTVWALDKPARHEGNKR